MNEFAFDRVATVYTPATTDEPLWLKFFRDHSSVKEVVLESFSNGFEDTTVYFKDSSEPFPLFSLRSDSPVRRSLESLLESLEATH